MNEIRIYILFHSSVKAAATDADADADATILKLFAVK